MIARAWRVLTGGGRGRDGERRTLLACSGGADSAALVLALAAHAQDAAAVVVGHILHDMRPLKEARAERDRVRSLAESLGLECVESVVGVRGVKGNAEAVARERRYAALVNLARDTRCGFIATGHQGDDLLETVLMRLVRGTGVRGLVGIHESRRLEKDILLIRPMLGVTRADAERVCAVAGWVPNEDPTNQDASRLRARLRRDVVPVLRDVSPGVHARVLETSRLMQGVADLLESLTCAADGKVHLTRVQARAMPAVVLGEVLREAVRSRGHGLDTLSARVVGEACRVIQGAGTDAKTIRLGGVILRVTARDLVFADA